MPAQTKSGRVEGSSITNRNDQMKTRDRSPDQMGPTNRDTENAVQSRDRDRAKSQKMGDTGAHDTIKSDDRGNAKSRKMGETGNGSGMGMGTEHPDD